MCLRLFGFFVFAKDAAGRHPIWGTLLYARRSNHTRSYLLECFAGCKFHIGPYFGL